MGRGFSQCDRYTLWGEDVRRTVTPVPPAVFAPRRRFVRRLCGHERKLIRAFVTRSGTTEDGDRYAVAPLGMPVASMHFRWTFDAPEGL